MVSRGYSSLWCTHIVVLRASVVAAPGRWSTGSVVVVPGLWSIDSVVLVHGLTYSTACGIIPNQGSNPCPLHWQADSYPLYHQGHPWSCLFWVRSAGVGEVESVQQMAGELFSYQLPGLLQLRSWLPPGDWLVPLHLIAYYTHLGTIDLHPRSALPQPVSSVTPLLQPKRPCLTRAPR